jgi:hypothetical protein
MMASPRPLAGPPKRVTLLLDTVRIPLIDEVRTTFLDQGYELDECNIMQAPPPDQDVVSLLDLSGPFLYDVNAEKFGHLKQFISSMGSSGMLWVTKPSQIECEDPRYSTILGLARTVRTETQVDMATLELDKTNQSGLDALVKVFGKFSCRYRGSESELDPDYEFAFKDDTIYVSRFSFVSVKNALLAPVRDHTPRKLDISRRGFLQTLQFVQYDPAPLHGDCVEVDMRAVGLNFKVYVVDSDQIL